MNNGTVTITLEQYKQLERYELNCNEEVDRVRKDYAEMEKKFFSKLNTEYVIEDRGWYLYSRKDATRDDVIDKLKSEIDMLSEKLRDKPKKWYQFWR